MCKFHRHAGFTLVEMIIVIVITGIVAVAVAVFIRAPVQGYVDTVARAELTDEADTAVRRLSRDLRLALPNSVRVTSLSNGQQFLELLLTRTGGRYLDESDAISGGNILDFANSSDMTFTAVGALSTDAVQTIQIGAANHGDYVVVYNLGPGQDPANAYCAGDSCGNRAKIAGVAGQTITLAANPFALQSPSLRSPGHRFQIVSMPVTYACANGLLQRYANYPIAAVQATPPAGTPALLANGVVACSFSYTTLANKRSALVGITLGLSKANANAGVVTLFHQVHVDNTP
jgi:MSHA biogenesis protein MshO